MDGEDLESSVGEDNCFFIAIGDDVAFYRLLFKYVPDGSTMFIEGVLDHGTKTFETLKAYETHDDMKVVLGTQWPKDPVIKIKLSRKNKPKLLELFKRPGFGADFMHQHIYKDGKFFFSSYDTLDDIWIRKNLIPEKVLEQAVNDKIIMINN